MKQIFQTFRRWIEKKFIRLYLASLEKKVTKQEKICIKFSNPRELIETFKGTVLFQRCYSSVLEKQYFVGDLIQGCDIAGALGELESREAYMTLEGKQFLEYAFRTSNLEKYLRKNEYRDDYIKDQYDLLNFCSVTENGLKDPMGRVFNLLQSEDSIIRISKHLGIPREELQSEEILAYDASLRRSKNITKSPTE